MFTETKKPAPQQQTPLVPGGKRALGHAAPAGASEAEDRPQPTARPCSPVSSAGKHVRQQRRRSHHRRDNRGSLWREWDLESCPLGQHLPTATVFWKTFSHLQTVQISGMCNARRKQSMFQMSPFSFSEKNVNLDVANLHGWGRTGLLYQKCLELSSLEGNWCWKRCTQGSRMYSGNE